MREGDRNGGNVAEMFRDLAFRVHGSFANKFAENDEVKHLIRVFAELTPEQAAELSAILRPEAPQ